MGKTIEERLRRGAAWARVRNASRELQRALTHAQDVELIGTMMPMPQDDFFVRLALLASLPEEIPKPPFSKIDIYVTYEKEPDCWMISARSYVDVDDPDTEVEEYQESHGIDEKGEKQTAIEYAEEWAQHIFRDRAALSVTILVEGNEHKTLKPEDVK